MDLYWTLDLRSTPGHCGVMAVPMDAEPGSKVQCELFLACSLGQVKLPSFLELKTGSDISLGTVRGKLSIVCTGTHAYMNIHRLCLSPIILSICLCGGK